MHFSNRYTIGFAAAVCLVCSVLVSASVVLLKDRQERNAQIYKQKNVLAVSGAATPEEINSKGVEACFKEYVQIRIVDMATGDVIEGKTAPSEAVTVPPKNKAKVKTVPKEGIVYEVSENGVVKTLVFPVRGKGLWSTLYGYLALNRDTLDVRGLTFYDQGETPGLGGEIDNPKWKAKWKGVKAFDENGKPILKVAKGEAQAPNEVDGLSGATLTSRGVTNLLQFWLGDQGYGPYLAKLGAGGNG